MATLGQITREVRCEGAGVLCAPPYPLPTKGQIQIMIVLVFILSRYWFKSIILFLNMGAP